MKNNTIFKTVMIFCAVMLTAGVVLSVKTVVGFAGFITGSADEHYTAGDAAITEPVKNLVIDWTSGEVAVEYHHDNTVLLKETSKKDISPDMQMLWWLDGETLRVRYMKSGLHLFSVPEKKLTVTLPEDTVLGSVKIDATSAALNIPALQADEVSLGVTSGNICAVAAAREISTDATSGSVNLLVEGKAEKIEASSTSGDVIVEAGEADELEADTTSGSIAIMAKKIGEFEAESTSGSITAEIDEVKELSADSTSGDILVKAGKADTLKAESTSGDVTVSLPDESGFTGRFDTTSGKIDYELPLKKEGGSYICGDGNAKVVISTTSGDIKIMALDQ